MCEKSMSKSVFSHNKNYSNGIKDLTNVSVAVESMSKEIECALLKD